MDHALRPCQVSNSNFSRMGHSTDIALDFQFALYKEYSSTCKNSCEMGFLKLQLMMMMDYLCLGQNLKKIALGW